MGHLAVKLKNYYAKMKIVLDVRFAFKVGIYFVNDSQNLQGSCSFGGFLMSIITMEKAMCTGKRIKF